MLTEERPLHDEAMRFLESQGFLAPVQDWERYATDWPRDLHGEPKAVVRPSSAAEVASIVRMCAERGVPVVPQGGNTGLVGGATPSRGRREVVISLERLNQMREIDPLNFTITVEAGCILESVHAAAAAENCIFPLQLGAQGSCQIGGNIATNAGGLNVLRYGMMRDLVLGLEAVLPDGRIWNGLHKLRKNNMGYDLKQLFLGSEGTLGVVTAACLKLFPRPTQVETAILAVHSVANAVQLLGRARRDLCDLLSAFELLPRRGIELSLDAIHGQRDPLGEPSPFYVLMEVSATGLIDLRILVERFLEGLIADGMIRDGTLAANSAQSTALWRLREGLIEAQTRRGRHLRTDVSVPISSVARFLEETQSDLERSEPEAVGLAYGHLGDGNIHFNVLPPPALDDDERIVLLHRCEAIVFHHVDAVGGSISAEHGIGLTKRDAFLERTSAPAADLMRRIRTVLDPRLTMSPGRIFAESEVEGPR
jgi:FAD/FMN-containing dehydrogenase